MHFELALPLLQGARVAAAGGAMVARRLRRGTDGALWPQITATFFLIRLLPQNPEATQQLGVMCPSAGVLVHQTMLSTRFQRQSV